MALSSFLQQGKQEDESLKGAGHPCGYTESCPDGPAFGLLGAYPVSPCAQGLQDNSPAAPSRKRSCLVFPESSLFIGVSVSHECHMEVSRGQVWCTQAF